jgi:hypothetical protein
MTMISGCSASRPSMERVVLAKSHPQDLRSMALERQSARLRCNRVVVRSQLLNSISSALTCFAASTPTNIATSTSTMPQDTESTPIPKSASKSNAWIAGVIMGPIAGIISGAVLMWCCLRKWRNRKAQRRLEVAINNRGGWDQQFSDSQAPVDDSSQQMGSHGQYIAEAPDRTSPSQPAELWHGNYRS